GLRVDHRRRRRALGRVHRRPDRPRRRRLGRPRRARRHRSDREPAPWPAPREHPREQRLPRARRGRPTDRPARRPDRDLPALRVSERPSACRVLPQVRHAHDPRLAPAGCRSTTTSARTAGRRPRSSTASRRPGRASARSAGPRARCGSRSRPPRCTSRARAGPRRTARAPAARDRSRARAPPPPATRPARARTAARIRSRPRPAPSPRRRRAPSRARTDRAACSVRLDQPRGGRGDPVRRKCPLPAGDDRWLGAGRQGPEHQARRPPVRAPRRDQGADRGAAARSRGRSPTGPVRGASGLSEGGQPGWLAGARDRLAIVLDKPVARTVRRILDRYGAAGGGLLAGGLAYAALFAIVPAVLLLAGVIGLFVADPVERAKFVDVLVGVLPPLHDLIQVVLDEAARDAGPVSIIGAIVLIWGTSRFAVAFQDSIARIMGGDRERGLLV